jgi:uncharacterized OB-fold protein
MSAFEVYVNGRRVCTAALQGDGVLTTFVTFFRGAGRKGKRVQEAILSIGRLASGSQTHAEWLPRNLKVGDEVRVVLSSKKRGDVPKSKRRESKAKREQREREYVQKRAREFGWKISK